MFNFNDTRIRLLVLMLLLVAGSYFFHSSSKQTASVLYPNAGGTFDLGKSLEIRWTPGAPGIQGIDLIPAASFQKYNDPNGYYGDRVTVYYKQEYAYNSLNGGDTSGSYSFVPSAYRVLAGSYYIKIFAANNSGVISISDAPITFVGSAAVSPPVSTPAPFVYPTPALSIPATPVKVISPNGGESFTIDGSIRISWIGGKNKVQVAIAKGDYRPGTGDSHMGWITKNGAPNSYVFWDGNICVTPDYCRPVTYWQPSGSVKILVVSENDQGDICIQADRPCNLDVSDAPFTIKPRSLLPLPSPSSVYTAPVLQPEKTPIILTPQVKKTPLPATPLIKPRQSSRPLAPKISIPSSSNGTPILTILSPNGGETFAPGSPMKISWSSENTSSDMLVNLYLFSKNLEKHQDYVWAANIASYGKNTGAMDWVIPKDIKSGDNYFIRIGCQYPEGAPYRGCTTDDSDNALRIGSGMSSSGGNVEQVPPVQGGIVDHLEQRPEQRSGFFQNILKGMKSIFGF